METQKFIISTLGATLYKETIYASPLEDEANGFKTKYFVRSLQQSFPNHKVLLFLTKDAHQTHKEHLLNDNFTVIPIADGATEQEIWEIFQTVTSGKKSGELFIPTGSEVIFDVTNGYRHLPMIILSIAVFLQKVRGISVPHIYYGAYDATLHGKTPVFDLAPFMQMMDWSWAAEQMNRTGDPKELANSLKGVNAGKLTDTSQGIFRKLGNIFEGISTAENMIRPKELSEKVKRLGNQVTEAENIAKKYPAFLPLNEILHKAHDRLEMFLDYSDDWESAKGLGTLADLASFYLEKEKYVHAIILTSELLVTLFCIKHKKGDPRRRDTRREMVSQINQNKNKPEELIKLIAPVSKKEWNQLSGARNAVVHASYANQNSSTKLIEIAKENIPILIRHIHSLIGTIEFISKPSETSGVEL